MQSSLRPQSAQREESEFSVASVNSVCSVQQDAALTGPGCEATRTSLLRLKGFHCLEKNMPDDAERFGADLLHVV